MTSTQIDKILTEPAPSKLHIFLKRQTIDSLATYVGQDPLEKLNPAVHGLGYLFILYVYSSSFWILFFRASLANAWLEKRDSRNLPNRIHQLFSARKLRFSYTRLNLDK